MTSPRVWLYGAVLGQVVGGDYTMKVGQSLKLLVNSALEKRSWHTLYAAQRNFHIALVVVKEKLSILIQKVRLLNMCDFDCECLNHNYATPQATFVQSVSKPLQIDLVLMKKTLLKTLSL